MSHVTWLRQVFVDSSRWQDSCRKTPRHTVHCSEAWGRVRRRRRARPPSMQGNSSLRLSSFCSSRESISSLQWVGSQLLAAPKASVVPWISDSSQCAIQSANENKSELARVSSSSSWQVLPASVFFVKTPQCQLKECFFFRENTMWFCAIITYVTFWVFGFHSSMKTFIVT